MVADREGGNILMARPPRVRPAGLRSLRRAIWRSPLGEAQSQCEEEDSHQLDQKLSPTPVEEPGSIVELPAPDDNRAGTTHKQILDRLADEDHPVCDQQQDEATPKQSKNALEEVHFRSHLAITRARRRRRLEPEFRLSTAHQKPCRSGISPSYPCSSRPSWSPGSRSCQVYPSPLAPGQSSSPCRC
jgi:hypothetical protein